jgi:hypothetical protein
MSRSKPENRLMLHLDIKRKRVQLSVVGVVGVIAVCLAIITIAILLRVL